MKKVFSFLLVFAMVFSLFSGVTVFAEDDVNINAGDFWGADDPFAPNFNVAVEDGEDAGYIKNGANNTYTAVPYNGNEFLGWYVGDSVYSTEETLVVPAGSNDDFVAKFTDNNILPQPNGGFELGTIGKNLIGSSWETVNKTAGDSWRNISVTKDYAKSGEKSLALKSRYQNDVYAKLTNLEKDTYYVLSYYWMLPQSVVTDSPTAGDGYFGSIVTTNDINDLFTAKNNKNLGGDYIDKNISFVGGQWNKTEYVFYTGEETELRMFIGYVCADVNNGNELLYLDEFTVYKPDDQQSLATYTASVSGENCYTVVSNNKPVSYETEMWVAATPFGGYVFDGWYEDGVKVSDEAIYKFNITSNRNLVAKCIAASDVTLDIDKDSAVNLKDLVALAQYVAKWDVDVSIASADVDGSGSIELADVTLLARKLAGWDVDDKLTSSTLALPSEDLTAANLAQTLLAGKSEYYNKNAVINQGNKARIAKVFEKAQRGEDITIVGFGGSITQGAGATSANNRYGEKVAAWFQAQFSSIKVTYVNAGIGSTTSLVGVNRMSEDVLKHNPDFVIVDFSANDQRGDAVYRASYEAVIRRLLEADAAVLSVVFGEVGNYNQFGGANTNQYKITGFNEHLATLCYYDIPTIDYYGALWRYINAGVITWPQVGNDYIHPNNNGHLMAASAINAYLADVLADVENIDTTVPAIPEEYFFADTYKNANFLNVEPAENNGFTRGGVHGGKINGWNCSTTGSTITFTANNATSVSVFLNMDAGYGKADIYINGEKVIADTDCNVSGNFIWIKYNKVFDEAQNITVTVKSTNGKIGLAPIGVTYAE